MIGAAVTLTKGQTWPQGISAFEALTGRPLPVRRCYDGAPVSDIKKSNAKHDLGKRKSILSIKPTMSTSVATVGSLAKSIVAAKHPCDVIIYHEPCDNMPGASFVALYKRFSAPLRAHGIPVGVCYTNWTCNLPYVGSRSALRHYWPGDSIVDFIAIDEYPIGEITFTTDALPMADRARRVCQFADARGIPLGVAEYGVDGSWDVAKSERWLRSVTDWATARAAAGKPLRWLSYFHSSEAGSYWLSNKQEYVDAYTDAARILD